MVQAIININKKANRILNIVKAKYDLKNKSEAINIVTEEYAEEILEPQLRPEYIKKLGKIKKEKSVKVGSLGNLRKRYEMK